MANESEGVETVRKVYVRDLREKQTVHTVFRVSAKKRQSARSGKSFLALELADRTGVVDARIFDNVDAAEGSFADGDYVLLKGEVIGFHGKPQVVITQLEKLDPEPIDPAEFTPPSREEREKAERPSDKGGEGSSRGLVDRISDPQIKALVSAVLDDSEIAASLRAAPLSRSHGSSRGGLFEHLQATVKLVHRLAEHFGAIDRDLAVGGAILRLAARALDASAERDFDHTDSGRLLGAGVAAAQKIREHAARLRDFPRALEQHLTHIAIAGEARPPVTLEALVVARATALEEEVSVWVELMTRDSHDRWTEPNRFIERALWKGPAPTARGRAPVAPKPPRGARKGGEKKDGAGGGEKREAAPVVSKKLPTFKPLTEMSPTTSGEAAAPEASAEAAPPAAESEAPPPSDGAPVLDAEAKQP